MVTPETTTAITAGGVQQACYRLPDLTVRLDSMQCSVPFYATQLPAHDAILGTPFMATYSPSMNWQSKEVRLHSPAGSVTLTAAPMTLPATQQYPGGDRSTIFSAVPPLHAPAGSQPESDQLGAASPPLVISALQMKRLLRQPIAQAWLAVVQTPEEDEDIPPETSSSGATRDPALAAPPAVQALLQQYADVFPSVLPPGLPPSRGVDHDIELLPGAKPPVGCTYKCLIQNLMSFASS